MTQRMSSHERIVELARRARVGVYVVSGLFVFVGLLVSGKAAIIGDVLSAFIGLLLVSGSIGGAFVLLLAMRVGVRLSVLVEGVDALRRRLEEVESSTTNAGMSVNEDDIRVMNLATSGPGDPTELTAATLPRDFYPRLVNVLEDQETDEASRNADRVREASTGAAATEGSAADSPASSGSPSASTVSGQDSTASDAGGVERLAGSVESRVRGSAEATGSASGGAESRGGASDTATASAKVGSLRRVGSRRRPSRIGPGSAPDVDAGSSTAVRGHSSSGADAEVASGDDAGLRSGADAGSSSGAGAGPSSGTGRGAQVGRSPELEGGLPLRNQLREWKVAVREEDLRACRRLHAALVDTVDPEQAARLTETLNHIATHTEQQLRTAFVEAVRSRRFSAALEVGEEIRQLFPESPAAADFRRLQPALRRRLGPSMLVV
jgi:hypothetical protein